MTNKRRRRRSRSYVSQRVEDNAFHQCSSPDYGRGGGVGRSLGGGLGLGVAVGVRVTVAVGVGVAGGVAVGVWLAVAVGVGEGVPNPVGAWIATVIGEPVLKKPTVAFTAWGGVLESKRKL